MDENIWEEEQSMGRFVDPDNSAFQDAFSSKIYIDKMGLISYTNGVIDMTE